jgi:malonyl-CoA/methylmalonyl-CoA synthetase
VDSSGATGSRSSCRTASTSIDLWIAGVKLGLILVPVNVLYRERELKHILAGRRAGGSDHFIRPSGLDPRRPGRLGSRRAVRPKQPGSRRSGWSRACDADTPLALIYTSGTTGASKGAVLTHRNFAADGEALAREWRFTEFDRCTSTLPLFHVHGLANGIHCWLISGCHLRLTERFEHARAAEWFEDYRPTVFFGVPAMFIRLLELPPEVARPIGARLRLAVSGSAPLPSEVHDKFRQLYGSVILERYGMTETLMNISNPYDGERRPGDGWPAFTACGREDLR